MSPTLESPSTPTSSPSSVPSTEPHEVGEDVPASPTEAVPFDAESLIEDDVQEEVILSAEPVVPAVPPQTPTPPATPTEPTPAVAPVETPPVVTPPTEVKPVVAAPAQPETPAVVPPVTPAASFNEEWGKIRKEGLTALETHYSGAIDDKIRETFGEDAAKELPRMQAALHMNIFENVLNAVYTAIPDVVRGMQNQDSAKTAFEAKFFGMFPALKEHPADVLKASQMYHQLNPGVSAEQLMRDVGLQLSISKRLNLPEGFVTPPPPPAAPQVPAFKPAAPGSAAASPVAPVKGRFETLIEDEE